MNNDKQTIKVKVTADNVHRVYSPVSLNSPSVQPSVSVKSEQVKVTSPSTKTDTSTTMK